VDVDPLTLVTVGEEPPFPRCSRRVPCVVSPHLQTPDTNYVASRFTQVSLGLVWTVSGVLMAFNPPPVGYRRSEALPFVGWVVMAGGIFIAAKGLRAQEIKASGNSPRHASGDEANVRDAIKFVCVGVVGVLAGVGTLWWGISSGLLSVLGMGIATLGLSVLAIPHALSALTWLLRRRKH
jgi:hypothetical protein